MEKVCGALAIGLLIANTNGAYAMAKAKKTEPKQEVVQSRKVDDDRSYYYHAFPFLKGKLDKKDEKKFFDALDEMQDVFIKDCNDGLLGGSEIDNISIYEQGYADGQSDCPMQPNINPFGSKQCPPCEQQMQQRCDCKQEAQDAYDRGYEDGKLLGYYGGQMYNR